MCRDRPELRVAFLAHLELGNKDVIKSIGVCEGVHTGVKFALEST